MTLIEPREPQVERGALGIDIRNVALSPASRLLLDAPGVWSELSPAPYRRMVVWEQWGTGRVEFDAAQVGRDELGWVVEMSPLVAALWRALGRQSGVTIRSGAIEQVEASDEAVAMSFADGATAAFDFAVAADGARSVVRRALNVRVSEAPTGQVALATVVRTEHAHHHTAWQRFLLDGPLALLPSPDNHVCSVVWSQSPEQAQRRQTLDAAAFCGEISRASEWQLGRISDCDQRIAFPLMQQHVRNCAPHPRVLLVGDAMRVVHPLAGLGVNLGLEDVSALLETARGVDDLASASLWRRFARIRRARSAAMIQTLGLLQSLYAASGPGMSLLRNVGVHAFNALPALKHQVMREAMGLGPLSGRRA